MDFKPELYIVRPDGKKVAILFTDELAAAGMFVLGAPSSLTETQITSMGLVDIGNVEERFGRWSINVNRDWYTRASADQSLVYDPSEPQSAAEVMEAEYFIRRNGRPTAVIMADELPSGVDLVGVPRVLSDEYIEENRMAELGEVDDRPQEHGGVHTVRFAQVFIDTNGLGPRDDNAGPSEILPAPQTPPRPRRPNLARWRSAPAKLTTVVARYDGATSGSDTQDTRANGHHHEQESQFTCPRCGCPGHENKVPHESQTLPALARETDALAEYRLRYQQAIAQLEARNAAMERELMYMRGWQASLETREANLADAYGYQYLAPVRGRLGAPWEPQPGNSQSQVALVPRGNASGPTSTNWRTNTRPDVQKVGPPRHDPNKDKDKKYCTHWIRTGLCAWTLEGCKFLHRMPDEETLRSLGIKSGYPHWYRRQQGIEGPEAKPYIHTHPTRRYPPKFGEEVDPQVERANVGRGIFSYENSDICASSPDGSADVPKSGDTNTSQGVVSSESNEVRNTSPTSPSSFSVQTSPSKSICGEFDDSDADTDSPEGSEGGSIALSEAANDNYSTEAVLGGEDRDPRDLNASSRPRTVANTTIVGRGRQGRSNGASAEGPDRAIRYGSANPDWIF